MDKTRISEADVKDLIAGLNILLYKAYRDNDEMEKRYEAEIDKLNARIGELEGQIHANAVKSGTKINKLADKAAHLEKENWTLSKALSAKAELTRNALTPKDVNFDYVDRTTTFTWLDGTRTSVRLESGGLWSDYDAFTAALAKKVFGTNSAVKSVLKRVPASVGVGYADNDH